jgi:hypothetical protein
MCLFPVPELGSFAISASSAAISAGIPMVQNLAWPSTLRSQSSFPEGFHRPFRAMKHKKSTVAI